MSDPLLHAEDESYFVSMTDLMVGLLFIFIILLMVFALNLKKQEQEFVKTTEELRKANEARQTMLTDIRDAMQQRGVTVIVDTENGVLRLPESILFLSGDHELTANGAAAVCRLAEVLRQTLPDYTFDATVTDSTLSAKPHLEAVYVEGHTDDQQYQRNVDGNWLLSSRRAISVYRRMTDSEPELMQLHSDSDQPLIGVSGYADSRPAPALSANTPATAGPSLPRVDSPNCQPLTVIAAADHSGTTASDTLAKNRRIELRFIMASPRPELVEKLEAATQ